MSWWPKVTTWENSGIDFGCWTPMCERWFRNRLESLREGKAKTFSSKEWYKNLRYQKETKKFLTKWKSIGEDFLIKGCGIRNL